MSSQSDVMHCYEQLSTLTEHMRSLACSKRWGELPALEMQYSDTVNRLDSLEALETLTEAQSMDKYQLLSRIIANHHEIANCVLPQLTLLGNTLKSLERQDSLQKAYGRTDASQL